MNDNAPALFQHWLYWGMSLLANETVFSVHLNVVGRSVRK